MRAPSRSAHEERERRGRRVLALQLVLWPALLLAAEGAYRVWARAAGAPYDATATLDEIRGTAGALSDDLPDPGRGRLPAEEVDSILHPYLAFAPEYTLEVHAREWLRFAEGRRDEGEFLVLLLGGSVAGGFGNRKSAGVRRFAETVNADPRLAGRFVRFLSYGHGAYKQPQQTNFANYLFSLGIRPDAVVNLDGFNEVALALTNGAEGVSPIYPIFSKWGHRLTDWGADVQGLLARAAAIEDARADARRWAERAEATGLWRSALVGRFLLGRVRAAERAHRAASAAYLEHVASAASDPSVKGPPHPKRTDRVLESSVRIWSESSRSLHAMCAERGIYYFHALQPTLHDIGSKPVTDEERRTGRAKETWLTGAAEGYPLLRAEGQRLRAQGIAFHDASRAFADVAETLYYDACHFNQKGNGILGEQLGKAFLELW